MRASREACATKLGHMQVSWRETLASAGLTRGPEHQAPGAPPAPPILSSLAWLQLGPGPGPLTPAANPTPNPKTKPQDKPGADDARGATLLVAVDCWGNLAAVDSAGRAQKLQLAGAGQSALPPVLFRISAPVPPAAPPPALADADGASRCMPLGTWAAAAGAAAYAGERTDGGRGSDSRRAFVLCALGGALGSGAPGQVRHTHKTQKMLTVCTHLARGGGNWYRGGRLTNRTRGEHVSNRSRAFVLCMQGGALGGGWPGQVATGSQGCILEVMPYLLHVCVFKTCAVRTHKHCAAYIKPMPAMFLHLLHVTAPANGWRVGDGASGQRHVSAARIGSRSAEVCIDPKHAKQKLSASLRRMRRWRSWTAARWRYSRWRRPAPRRARRRRACPRSRRRRWPAAAGRLPARPTTHPRHVTRSETCTSGWRLKDMCCTPAVSSW